MFISMGGKMKHLTALALGVILSIGASTVTNTAMASEEFPDGYFLFKKWLFCTGEKDVFFDDVPVCEAGVKVAYTVNDDSSQLQVECIDKKIVWIADIAPTEDIARDWRSFSHIQERYNRNRFKADSELSFKEGLSSDRSLFYASDRKSNLASTVLRSLRAKNTFSVKVSNVDDLNHSLEQEFSLAGSAKTIRTFMANCETEADE